MLVALDVDGTLLHYDGHLSETVRDAVQAVARAGHHVTIATGRSVLGVMEIAGMLGLDRGFAVASNGAVTIELDPSAPNGYRIVETVTFDPAPVLKSLENAWPDAVVAVEEIGIGSKVSAPFPDGELLGTQRVVSWEEMAAEPTTRVTFRSPTGTSDDFVKLAPQLGLHGVSYGVGYTAWLDINPEGVSKASALEQIRRNLHVEPAATVAIGDHRNDLEMLTWAARGVAMGQALDDVLAVADEVTGTIDEDGAVPVLRSLILP
ncbi:HAD family hydrolase [Leekyejoonella antrihumi]|uniref:HAD family phosphatase n=1 Tax=Leekyejoonella antrihumi TaxID=1660198 RepID=A0A563E7Y1_9MICO|nr:HAD family hydrolase [Leekyejoonella antrihumi]TWP38353.1 HAD family phosphatase [Leekyejoonella antrihumi]